MTTKGISQSEPMLQGKKHFIAKEHLKYDAKFDVLSKDLGYGVVYRGSYQGKQVAIKVINAEVQNLSKSNLSFLTEIEKTMDLSHENFMPYAGWSHDEQMIYIVSPWIENGSLFNLLQKDTISSDFKIKLVEDIVKGIAYLHENDVVHRDLKASNIMITSDFTAQVNDLGIAKFVKEDTKQDVVPKPSIDLSIFRPSLEKVISLGNKLTGKDTLHRTKSELLRIENYVFTVVTSVVPPELTRNAVYSKEGDIYAFGCVLFEMLTLKHPYQYEIEEGDIDGVDIWTLKKKGIKPIVPNEEALLKDAKLAGLLAIMHKCLDAQEMNRPTCFDILADLRAINSKVFKVSTKVGNNTYSTLKEALYVRSLLSESEKVAIFVSPGTYVEADDIQLDKDNTAIIGTAGSVIKGHFLTISKDNVLLEHLTFEGANEDFHVNIAFCSPTVKRCNIHGGFMIFGDENTKPTICYNIITNANFISNIAQYGTFKHNQFQKMQTTGKKTSYDGVGVGIGVHSAKCLASALGNPDVTVMNLSDHNVNDVAAKYIAASLQKCSKLVKIDMSLNTLTTAGAKSIASALSQLQNLQVVEFADNDIGAKGCKAILAALQNCPNLKRVSISYNNVGKKTGKYVTRLLKHPNCKVEYLDISYNKIGDSGAGLLIEGIQAATNLKTLIATHNDFGAETEAVLHAVAKGKPNLFIDV